MMYGVRVYIHHLDSIVLYGKIYTVYIFNISLYMVLMVYISGKCLIRSKWCRFITTPYTKKKATRLDGFKKWIIWKVVQSITPFTNEIRYQLTIDTYYCQL